MNKLQNAVFLSYASQDAEAARRICDALRAAGIDVWFDQSELRGGDDWDRRIREQIQACALFVPVISANTQARLEGYFRLEWRLAVERTHLMADAKPFLVPLVIDSTRDQDAEVPGPFRAVQWTHLPAGEASSAFAARIARLLSPERSQALPERGAVAPRPALARSFWQRRLPVVAVAFCAVISLGYLTLVKFDLQKHPTVAMPIADKSIAVLPFVDLSEQNNQEYFADGMAEEILNLLVTIPDLKVIARTSSFQYKRKTDDLRKIGATLGAAYLVEGSVRRSGDQFRVTAQLIDARNGTPHWSGVYDRNIDDVLKVQGEVATSLVRALQLEVTNLLALSTHQSPRSNEAYDLYLRGLHAKDQFDRRGDEEAVADFRRALALDPAFVAAAEALAVALANAALSGYERPQTAWEQARAAANHVLTLDPESALGHALLGIVHVRYDWDWQAADREFKIAIDQAPNRPFVLNYAAKNRMALGDWGDATRLVNAASALDPLDPGFEYGRGVLYLHMGRIADAERAFRRMLDISPTFEEGYFLLGTCLLLGGRADAAIGEMRKETRPAYQLAGLALAQYALSKPGEADAALARLEAGYADESALQIAEVHAYRGRKSQAFKWLDRAFAQKDVRLWSIKGDPLLKSLESDARYDAFLKKMKLPDQH